MKKFIFVEAIVKGAGIIVFAVYILSLTCVWGIRLELYFLNAKGLINTRKMEENECKTSEELYELKIARLEKECKKWEKAYYHAAYDYPD